ncbi:MAG: acyl carrier protein [Candidatus Gastranaerophilales bacterium]|nr:acyl carrier protein [Candidatus Gastranaerophilales bacterium]
MFEKIQEMIAESLGVDKEQVVESASFADDLSADSLDLFELAMAFEEEFQVEIPAEDLEKLRTVGDVVQYIESRQ